MCVSSRTDQREMTMLESLISFFPFVLQSRSIAFRFAYTLSRNCNEVSSTILIMIFPFTLHIISDPLVGPCDVILTALLLISDGSFFDNQSSNVQLYQPLFINSILQICFLVSPSLLTRCVFVSVRLQLPKPMIQGSAKPLPNMDSLIHIWLVTGDYQLCSHLLVRTVSARPHYRTDDVFYQVMQLGVSRLSLLQYAYLIN